MYDVLLVDDEPRALNAIERSIDWRRYGIGTVYKAMNMATAVEIMKRSRVDILICDIEMPNGSGIALLEWLREQKMSVNCIFVTCHFEFEIMRRAIQLKCYDYVLKPVDYDEFSMVLGALVNKMESGLFGAGEAENTKWGNKFNMKVQQKGNEKEPVRNIELEVKRYVREHMMDNITIPDIAACLHFNPQYLMRAFKAKTGMSILEYMTFARMEQARQLLKTTNLPVKEIACMVGYEDCVYFTKLFRKETGTAPSKYRKLHGRTLGDTMEY